MSHYDSLQKLCRICGLCVKKRYNYCNPKPCLLLVNVIFEVFDIEIPNDVHDKHPKMVCPMCIREMKRCFQKKRPLKISKLREKHEHVKSVWCEFDETKSVSECTACQRYAIVSRGCVVHKSLLKSVIELADKPRKTKSTIEDSPHDSGTLFNNVKTEDDLKPDVKMLFKMEDLSDAESSPAVEDINSKQNLKSGALISTDHDFSIKNQICEIKQENDQSMTNDLSSHPSEDFHSMLQRENDNFEIETCLKEEKPFFFRDVLDRIKHEGDFTPENISSVQISQDNSCEKRGQVYEKSFSTQEKSTKLTRKWKRSSHTDLHFGRRLFSCKVCNIRFSKKSHLAKHDCTNEGSRLLSCNICSKSFSQISKLKNHQLVHAIMSLEHPSH